MDTTTTVAPATTAPDSTPLVQQTPAVSTAPASATLTAGMSSSQAQSILNSLGINVNDVLSSSNVTQTINNPTPAPDDLLGIYNQVQSEYNIPGLQTAFNNAQAGYMNAQSALTSEENQSAGRPVSMSKITGEQGQESLEAQGNITNLENAATIAQNSLNSATTNAQNEFSIRESQIQQTESLMYQYPSAGIKIGDSSSTISSKIAKYQQDQADQATKDQLKQTAMTLGISLKNSKGGTLSTSRTRAL